MRYVIMLCLEVILSPLQCCLEIPVRKALCFLGIVPKASSHFIYLLSVHLSCEHNILHL